MKMDDLNLEVSTGGINDPDFLKAITETEEFAQQELEESNRSLKDQIQRLTKQVLDKNSEIDRLLKKIERTKKEKLDILDASGDTVAEKLINLTKRCSSLNLEMERERTKNRVLEKEIRDLKNQQLELADQQKNLNPSIELQTLQKLKSELNTATSRAMESRNECLRLRQEIRLYNKALIQEVGEDVSIDQILNSSKEEANSNWRGRSQKIQFLQNKLNEYKKRLETDGNSKVHIQYVENQKSIKELSDKRKKEIESLKVLQEEMTADLAKKEKEISGLRSRASHQSMEGKNLRFGVEACWPTQN